MAEHDPGDAEIAVRKAPTTQTSAAALLEDGNATLGRAAPALQPDKPGFPEPAFEFRGIARANRIVNVARQQRRSSRAGRKTAVATGGLDLRGQVEGVLSVDALLQLSPLRRRLLPVQLPVQDQTLGAPRRSSR